MINDQSVQYIDRQT